MTGGFALAFGLSARYAFAEPLVGHHGKIPKFRIEFQPLGAIKQGTFLLLMAAR